MVGTSLLLLLRALSIAHTAVSALPWMALYGAVFFTARLLGPALFPACAKLDSPGRSYWASSVCSTVNGFILTPMAWFACQEAGLLSPDASFYSTSPLSYMACHAMIGYTAFDSIPLLYHRREWSGVGPYIVHHAASLLSWGFCGATGLVHNTAVPVLLVEGTAPFVNGRYFLSTHGYKQTRLYLLNGVAMFLSFLVLRVVLNWYIFFVRLVWQHDAFAAMPVSAQLLFYPLMPLNLALQLFWFFKICKGIIALLQGGAGKASDELREVRALKKSVDASEDDDSYEH